jgi:hypothetical protein
MPPLERARLARDIAGPVRAALGHVVDESIAAALVDPFPQRRSYVDVAGALSVSTSRVNKSITRYRAWLNTRRAPKETAS